MSRSSTGRARGLEPLAAKVPEITVPFWRWHRSEGTLDIHSITTRRRESFYWAAVLATFALGTAAGDLTAIRLDWGFLPSAILFGAIIAVPMVG